MIKREFTYGIESYINTKGPGYGMHRDIEHDADFGPDIGEPGETAEEFAHKFALEIAANIKMDNSPIEVTVDGDTIYWTEEDENENVIEHEDRIVIYDERVDEDEE